MPCRKRRTAERVDTDETFLLRPAILALRDCFQVADRLADSQAPFNRRLRRDFKIRNLAIAQRGLWKRGFCDWHKVC
jgi:hypothetical protein